MKSLRARFFALSPCLFLFGSFLALTLGSRCDAQQESPGLTPCSAEIESRIAVAVNNLDYKSALAAANQLEQDASSRFGVKSRCYAAALSEQAVILQLADRGVEAQPIFERAIALLRSNSNPQDSGLGIALNKYGVNLFWLRRYQDAARVHEEALDLLTKAKPALPSDVAESLHDLADDYRYLNRPLEDVRKLYEEALKIKLGLPVPDEVSIAETRQNLADALQGLALQGRARFQDAQDELDQAQRIYKKRLRPDDTRQAAIFNRQGLLLFVQGAYKPAEGKFAEALRLERASSHTQRITLAATLDDFALNEIQLGQYEKAKALANEALAIRRSVFPENNPTTARTLANLAYLAWLTRNIDDAISFSGAAVRITQANGRNDDASKFRYQRHLLMLWSKFAENGSGPWQSLMEEAFAIGQQAIRSDTAATVARTALRFSAHDSQLRDLLKEIDDLDRASAGLEQTLTHSLASEQTTIAFSQIRSELSSLYTRRLMVLGEIRKSFPQYSRLVDPAPVSVSAVQKLLEPNEALVAYAVGFEDIYVWCVTAEGVVWRKIDLSPKQLARAVVSLRESLESDPEDSGDTNKPLFDLGMAHALYDKLVEPIAPQLRSKTKLIVVPSGPLIGLPLHLLITARPTISTPTRDQPSAYKTADWLIKRFAVSEIPSVESLERLRRRVQAAADRQPLIGFANPLPSPDFVWSKQAITASVSTAITRGLRSNRGLPATVGEAHDIAALRTYLEDHPLHETEDELKEVAEIVGAPPDDLFMGARATETALKKAKLSGYGIIYFATHGYLAGLFNESEPALSLTVPRVPDENDDGLLTASEISLLSLDADWVVLSACDTASPEGKGAEGLSGLARAFFHAGARALLVSNWGLDDISARQIMGSTFRALQQDRALSKSQALRRAMISQVDGANSESSRWDSYPGRWAALEVVGVD